VRFNPRNLWLAAVLAGALALTCTLAYARFSAGQTGLRDFLSFYAGARLFAESPPVAWSASASALYSVQEQQRTEARLQPGAPYMPCLRPPLFFALLAPLSRLPLNGALAAWLVLNGCAALALGLWAARRMEEPALLLLLAVFVPLIVALSVGQDTPLLVLLLVGCLYLLEERVPSPKSQVPGHRAIGGRETWDLGLGTSIAAGLLLSSLWVKPQWLPPFVLLLAAKRRWRALAALAAGSAAVWLVFPPLPYIRFAADMRRYPGVPVCPECMPNVRGLLAGLRVGFGTGELAAAVAAVVVWGVVFFAARRRSFAGGFALACVAALAAGYYSHIYDCLLVVPALAIAGPALAARWQKMVAGAALSPLPYLAAYWSPHLRIVPAITAIAVFIAVLRQQEL
jgi:hypothetical protein